MGSGPWGHKESLMTEQQPYTHTKVGPKSPTQLGLVGDAQGARE